MKPVIAISTSFYDQIVAHVLPDDTGDEQVAFLFLRPSGDSDHFDVVEHMLVPRNGFVHQSAFHLELSDKVRATAIKTAHDLGASLAEVHSHPWPARAAFSPSDLAGLDDFVPHVWWRLKGRPYFAFVMGLTSFDALAWVTSPTVPSCIDHIRVANDTLRPTGITLTRCSKP